MNFAPEFIKAIETSLLKERAGVAKNIQGAPQIEFRCLSHADNHPSAHWHTQKLVWKCRACGAGGGVKDLARALGLDPEKAIAKPTASRRMPAPGQRPVATYEYTDIHGGKHIKERFEFPDELDEDGKPKKSFTWNHSRGGLNGVPVADMRLYWLEDPAKRPDDPVVLVEGEKALEAVWQRGILACTGGWSGSQRTFNPLVFEELRGRTVWLSPDNDETGREYEAAVQVALRNIAKAVRHVRVPLPPKGDLFDFFAAGGDPEAIWSGDLAETAVDFLSHDSIRVRVPSPNGVISFTATELMRSARNLDCKLSVALEGAGHVGKPLRQRINVLSSSACSGLRLDLSKKYEFDSKFNWTSVVNEAASALDEAYSLHDAGQDAFDIPDGDDIDDLLLGDVLPRNQPTIFFGDGASLKSYLALFCGMLLAIGLPFPGGWSQSQAFLGSAMYIDFENVGESALRRRLRRLFAGVGINDIPPDTFYYWPGRGIPLAVQIDAIREKIRRHNIQCVIIDSVAGAIGGKPEDSDMAIAYFNALAKLNVTTINVAHINKERDIYKPFGSSFWYNFSRRIWYIQKAGTGDYQQVGMYCRKVNDGPEPDPKALNVKFTGRSGEVEIWHESFLSVDRSLDRLRPMPLRLHDALTGGAQTANALATQLGSKGETVARYLNLYPDRFAKIPQDEGKPMLYGLKVRESA